MTRFRSSDELPPPPVYYFAAADVEALRQFIASKPDGCATRKSIRAAHIAGVKTINAVKQLADAYGLVYPGTVERGSEKSRPWVYLTADALAQARNAREARNAHSADRQRM